jgi:hypothetical protein
MVIGRACSLTRLQSLYACSKDVEFTERIKKTDRLVM